MGIDHDVEERLALFDEHERFLCIAHRQLDSRERSRIASDRLAHERDVLAYHRSTSDEIRAAPTLSEFPPDSTPTSPPAPATSPGDLTTRTSTLRPPGNGLRDGIEACRQAPD